MTAERLSRCMLKDSLRWSDDDLKQWTEACSVEVHEISPNNGWRLGDMAQRYSQWCPCIQNLFSVVLRVANLGREFFIFRSFFCWVYGTARYQLKLEFVHTRSKLIEMKRFALALNVVLPQYI